MKPYICHDCSVPLTPENQYPSDHQKGIRMCKGCQYARVVKRRATPEGRQYANRKANEYQAQLREDSRRLAELLRQLKDRSK